MKLVSTTLCGTEGIDTIGAALRSIAPHVDLCIVIDTIAPEDDAGHVALLAAVGDAMGEQPYLVQAWPWTGDFSAARNAALDIATAAGAEWCVWLDSDEWLEGGEEIRPFLTAITRYPLHEVRIGEAPRKVEETAVMMAHASGSYYQPRAIRLPCRARWHGRVHECIDVSGPRLERARFCDRPKTPEQMRAKRTRDACALRLMTAEQPDDPRWWYYLGDALSGLDSEGVNRPMQETALHAFERCARLPGWDEQAAWAFYRAAVILTGALGRHDEAVEMCAAGLARHAGIAELAWMAALASYRAGRYEQAIYWSRLADVHGVPGLGGDGRALRSRTLFREPKGLTFGPAEVREHALRALGETAEAEHAATIGRHRLEDVAHLSGAVDVGPETEGEV